MPHVELNGARIFYRAYGDPASPRPPILLIHGATVDGATDWGTIAPVLGLGHRVIVPDCRGHGRSTSPTATYRFAELAADMAALVRALGHRNAHVVGHSNGGNVALVTLVEHPDVVTTCIVQAANAYVSPDLLEHEPANFDPGRVDRDSPRWRDQMIRLHGRWHGQNYWRMLLGLTVAEIVSAPEYGPADLAGVDRPTLVIEGQEDRVNARSHHGEFIATHIPFAELWRPADVGHAVHEERAGEWLTRAEDFWSRRGTPAREAVWRVGHADTTDRRTTVIELDVELDDGSERITGVVLNRDQHDALATGTAGSGIGIDVRVLDERARPAVVRTGIVDVLDAPGAAGRRVTQALFGELVEVLQALGDFRRVRLVRDGYLGWLGALSVVDTSGPGDGSIFRVWSDVATAHVTPGGQVVGQLPFGSRLVVAAEAGDWVAMRAGSGAELWWLQRREIRPCPTPVSPDAAIARFRRFAGLPYLWGGRSPWGFDCSGLAQAFYDALGVAIPRDADQQWAAGLAATGEARPGDLLFFADPVAADRTRPVHVAIATDARAFLHAWGATGSVATGSLDAHAPAAARLAASFLGARRYPIGIADRR